MFHYNYITAQNLNKQFDVARWKASSNCIAADKRWKKALWSSSCDVDCVVGLYSARVSQFIRTSFCHSLFARLPLPSCLSRWSLNANTATVTSYVAAFSCVFLTNYDFDSVSAFTVVQTHSFVSYSFITKYEQHDNTHLHKHYTKSN